MRQCGQSPPLFTAHGVLISILIGNLHAGHLREGFSWVQLRSSTASGRSGPAARSCGYLSHRRQHDPRSHRNPDAFPILMEWDFFNHAGVCPLPKAAADALRKYAQQAESVAYIDTGWYRDIEKTPYRLCQIINATPKNRPSSKTPAKESPPSPTA